MNTPETVDPERLASMQSSLARDFGELFAQRTMNKILEEGKLPEIHVIGEDK